MALLQIISGGQTGADRAGLIAARAADIKTGGWMPMGFLANDGEHPEFAERYGIVEMSSKRFPPRTAMNVTESDGTLRFATHWESPGELLTLKLCKKYRKPFLDIAPGGQHTPHDVAAWIAANDIRVLNVAGNAEQTSPGIQEFVVDFLSDVFRLLLLSAPAA
ncbi:MAG TPA: putative molybdenum carrier protein [Gemmata sp.]|jgi:hypothetical protein|nr:putative molybdenum carrier protein [Gemmata sp.]